MKRCSMIGFLCRLLRLDVPLATYLKLHEDYMTSEAERASAEDRAVTLQAENVCLRRRLKVMEIWHDEFSGTLEELLECSVGCLASNGCSERTVEQGSRVG